VRAFVDKNGNIKVGPSSKRIDNYSSPLSGEPDLKPLKLCQCVKLYAMPKEKSINPAQAQRKAEKAKAIKKGTPTSLHSRSIT